MVWMATGMKFDKRLEKISEKSQSRMERVAIILGVSLLVVSSISYFAVEAFGQQDLVELHCSKDAYYGLDNQGNKVCRDIKTNQILEAESMIIINSFIYLILIFTKNNSHIGSSNNIMIVSSISFTMAL